MTGLFSQAEARAKAARRRFSAFDEELFFELCAGPARELHRSVDSIQVLDGYLDLLVEGVGVGLVTRSSVQVGSGSSPVATEVPSGESVFVRVMLELVPRQLSRVDPQDRTKALVRLFNIVDGLSRESGWVSAWLMSAISKVDELGALESELAAELSSLDPPTTKSPPGRVSCLDARPVAPRFLPGELHFADAHVICVHDARMNVQLGLCVGLEPRLSNGPVQCLGHRKVSAPALELDPRPDGIAVGGRLIPLPLGSPRSVLASELGFVVVTSESSQRVWVVEGLE
ncbi:MAG: hypothetical protein HY791_00630 [Deltaproteobacteria bacterium]|nr:hypothetical protein [Deltaproteobacteria bacterium]